eukprot:XP_012823182.1 PREDICTED: zinc finger protein 488 [Xenopus tropicalis]
MDTPSRGNGIGHVRLAQATIGTEKHIYDACMGDEKVYPFHPIQKKQLMLWYDGHKSKMVDLQGLRPTFVYHEKDSMPTKCLLQSTNFHSLARDMEREKAEQAGNICKSLIGNFFLDEPQRRLKDLRIGIADCKETVIKLVKPESPGEDKSAFTEICKQRNTLAIGKEDQTLGISAFSPVPDRFGYKKKSLSSSCKSSEGEYMNLYNSVDNLAVETHCNTSFFTSCNFCSYKPPVNSSATETQPNSREASQLLPPSFTPLGATAQNLCAKCKLSFRMTSDLVLHMRSHHKKEIAGEPPHKRRRELQLSCPVCYAYFKERHHLSRHMTSHC